MQFRNTSFLWFTLIEMLIVITIMGIISVSAFLPYAHHQKKVLVKQWVKEVSQTIAEARNFALNGLVSGSWNVFIALDFSSWATSIPYYVSSWSINPWNISSTTLYREKKLPTWVQLDSMWWWEELLISFSPISWELDVFPALANSPIEFTLSYKWSRSSALQKTVRYYTESFISDY